MPGTRRRYPSILFWSVITAAFIGPGTVTTCAAAGAQHRYSLLWTLLFSTVACVILQEAAARVAIVSGVDLGQAIRARFHAGAAGVVVLLLVLGGIILGCAAYEAGNILGAVSGAALGLSVAPAVATLLLGSMAGLLLWFQSAGAVARVMGIAVACMGAAFLAVALRVAPVAGPLLAGALIPSWPPGSDLLILGLVGTTVVPYNLFLGSSLARGQDLRDARLGLGIAIPIGGLISMGILVAGTAVRGTFSFESLAGTLTTRLGGWAGPFFAFGLFAAGFTSAITAPMAAALTARSLFARDRSTHWQDRSWRYRSIWGTVLLTGIGFGLSGIRPIPAILIAQALNGLLLPFVGIFLLIVLNDRSLMGDRGLNGTVANAALAAVVGVTLLLGLSRGIGAVAPALGSNRPGSGTLLLLTSLLAAALAVPITRTAWRGRSGRPSPR